jgi:hypothetical protein
VVPRRLLSSLVEQRLQQHFSLAGQHLLAKQAGSGADR